MNIDYCSVLTREIRVKDASGTVRSDLLDAVKIDAALVEYILQLAMATREHDDLLIGISQTSAYCARMWWHPGNRRIDRSGGTLDGLEHLLHDPPGGGGVSIMHR